jgi:hypothetical protein
MKQSRNKATNLAYRKWCSMRQRCLNPKSHQFHRYGGRGIKICDRWLGPDGYDNFLADMGQPSEGLTLERINNNGDYGPRNCKWASILEQAANKNKRVPNPLTIYGRAQLAGLPTEVVRLRIHKLGWTEDKALTTPLRHQRRWASSQKIVRKSG